MKYTINRTNHCDFDTYEINKRNGRAYFIPYGSKERLKSTPIASERYSSDMVQVLSGEWDFKYFAQKSALPELFDTELESFEKINVPSTWQRTGYEPPVYLNCPYAFDTKPPKLPKEFSAGVYRKYFSISKIETRYIISFLGVIPCVDLYVNGKFVGYSEGAHNTAEFEITDFVVAGQNELVAVVHKWSNGTFLECQDMFRENGIFRDVLLYEMPNTFIDDYFLETKKCESGWRMNAQISLCGICEGYSVGIDVNKNNKTIVHKQVPAAESTIMLFENLPVEEWNAEIPTIYEIYIVLKKRRYRN
jgi:beta-galactosidase